MLFQTTGAESSGLDLVLPDSAALLWPVMGLVLLLAVVAGVVALVVLLARRARPPQSSRAQHGEFNDLSQRVRALEEQAQHQQG